MGMRLTDADLLVGERPQLTKRVNLIVSPETHGLREPTTGHLADALGVAGQEAVGGLLHLTCWRIIFKAHTVNRFAGTLSVLLPHIRAASDVSGRVDRKLRVDLDGGHLEFTMWRIAKFINALTARQRAIDAQETERLRRALRDSSLPDDGFHARRRS